MGSGGAFSVAAACVLLLGCGGASFTDGLNGPDDSGGASADGSTGDGGSTRDGSSSLDGATSNDSGSGGSDSGKPTDSGNDLDSPVVGNDAASLCPDVFGRYGFIQTSGLGCGDLNTNAPQCIRVTNVTTCAGLFTSQPGQGNTPGAINGPATFASDGSFANAALELGTTNRTGCTGSWNASTSTMTVDCGGSSSLQGCMVTMTRSGACP